MRTLCCSGAFRRSNYRARLIITTMMGMVFGYFVGISSPYVSLKKISLPSNLISSLDVAFGDDHRRPSIERFFPENLVTPKIYVPTNPHGAESLPPRIIVPETDFYLRRLWGEPSKILQKYTSFGESEAHLLTYLKSPSNIVVQCRTPAIDTSEEKLIFPASLGHFYEQNGQDLPKKPKYLVTFTVGLKQKENIDAAVKKFSEDFQILLFHYDGQTSEWEEFEWSKSAVHISVRKQTKWWYAKRFLHPDVVAAYDYIFIWDEDLGVENFNAEKYIRLVKRHGLEISQPGLEPNSELTWQMTKKRDDREVHKNTEERPGWCHNPNLPPCAAFVEIMAPVFSREAWRCVWHMIQNDLVHGWGLDFALRRCVEPAHENIGVVDSQWIEHQFVPSLGSQGESENGKAPWEGVRERCTTEWAMFQDRLANADESYFAQHGKNRI